MSEKRPERTRTPLNTSALKTELVNTPTAIDTEEEEDFAPTVKNEQSVPVRGFNVPERILIVFDSVKDEIETDFFDCGGKKVNPRSVMLRVLRMFIYNKLAISDKHCFALMTLNEGDSAWLIPKFTKNPQLFDKHLQKQLDGCDTEDIFNINHVFDSILEKHNPLINYDKTPPDSVYRVIFCYGRSFTLPILDETPEIKALLEAPNFFFDIVYTHESPSTTESKYVEILKLLQGLDRKGTGYSFYIERNLQAAHIAMASLLAHPLQRDPARNFEKFPLLGLKWKTNKKEKEQRAEDLIDLK